MTKARISFICGCALLATPFSGDAEEAAQEPAVLVEADRLPNPETPGPFTVHVLEQQDIEAAPELRLDDILRSQIPGFSLFRRDSSRAANPTTQGVTLRNFGPSGAGRTLVLLDGIPLNDPFAGYVLWSQVPVSSLQSVMVQPGGGAGLFGNAALAGTIYLTSKSMDGDSAYAEWSAGSRSTYEGAAGGTLTSGQFSVSASADGFSTGGYPVIAESQRGRVDTNASSRSEVVNIAGEWRPNEADQIRVNGRWFEDERKNGTFYTRNGSAGEDGSVTFIHRVDDATALQLAVYGQLRHYDSTFSSVNPARNVERPSQNQYDVPADAIGGSAVLHFAARQHRFTVGADSRFVDGETNELFSWNGQMFTRVRHAGGHETFAGVFLDDAWSVSQAILFTGDVRYDHWNLFDGFRREALVASGRSLSDLKFTDRSGDEINGRLGGRFDLTRRLVARVAGYSGFRVPTLNELYRPFRVGNDVTEANPDLKPEHLLGAEAGLEWRPLDRLTITGTIFANWLDDAISNVTIGFGPGTFNPGGFVPAGGVLRQRQNVDLVFAPGFEGSASWQITRGLSLKAGYLYTHPTIRRAVDPELRGNLLAQTPQNVFTSGLQWQPLARWTLSCQARYVDRQFEDDQNSRVLAPYTVVDASLSYEISARLSASLRAENLFDQEIQTGESASGVRSIGEPRLLTFTVRWRF